MPEAWIPASHGYSFCEVRRDGAKVVLRVYPRLWSEPRKSNLYVHGPAGGAQDDAQHDLAS